MSWTIEQRDPDGTLRFVRVAGSLSGRTVWTADESSAARYQREDVAENMASVVARIMQEADELPALTVRERA